MTQSTLEGEGVKTVPAICMLCMSFTLVLGVLSKGKQFCTQYFEDSWDLWYLCVHLHFYNQVYVGTFHLVEGSRRISRNPGLEKHCSVLINYIVSAWR